ncbi:MAG: hypothetical protein AB7F65_08025 [Dehalococcoidia bacterium]
MSRRRALALFALGLLAVLASGCRQERNAAATFVPRDRTGAGDPRPFLLGFSDVPAELTADAYVQHFDLVANYGEAILLQRPASWAQFLPGAEVSDELRDEVIAAREASRARDLEMVVALDPFDAGNRGRLGALPSEYAGRSLADPDLRDAFVAEATFIARNMRPEYLSLGTEVNATYERNPEGYFAFLEAYQEAYEAVKEASPQTQVFVTFQYEELLGVVPELPPHAPRWELLDDFGEAIDLIGITSYPSFAYPTARKVPAEYYVQLAEHTELPIAFAGVGFASGAGRAGVNASTEPEQRRFLQRLLEDAFALQAPMLIWFAAEDLGFAATPPYDLLSSIGLRNAEGTPKESWTVWEEASNRPLDPEAAAALLAQRGTPTPTPLTTEGTPTPTPPATATPEGTPNEAASGG